mmetsp:Transcript_54463/g.127054  ORF Transcript_54463/g.127054 Transcript_54463/m.127054 type:complete len:283 (+) Transcript_54463:1961-2809(+)
MHHSSDGAWHPSCASALQQLLSFDFQHGAHVIHLAPHAFGNPTPAMKPQLEANLLVAVFPGLDPGVLEHLRLAPHWPGRHVAGNVIAHTVQEADPAKDQTVGRRAQGLQQVQGAAPLLVDNAELDRARRQIQSLLHPLQQADNQSALFRSLHLWHDHVHGLPEQPSWGPEVVQSGSNRKQGIQHEFRHGLAPDLHRVCHHVQAQASEESQASALEAQRLTTAAQKLTVRSHATLHLLSILGKAGAQAPAHHRHPVGINAGLVCCVHRRCRVLHIHDGCVSRL